MHGQYLRIAGAVHPNLQSGKRNQITNARRIVTMPSMMKSLDYVSATAFQKVPLEKQASSITIANRIYPQHPTSRGNRRQEDR